ncbi:hypothetical protein [Agrobacterium vitis]|uniref:hypothetical protein n=3 Tax=Rhizobium/Agrobacterium group TaxID=227290 RepID=UPI001F417284|nr:hypothetical protein [Agrobacterium vitis]
MKSAEALNMLPQILEVEMRAGKITDTERHEGPRAPADDHRVIVIDPSDAVTGMGFMFGVVGALVGIVAAVYLAPSFSLELVGYSIVAAFAGGSAGIVTGGLVGAIFAVVRGVTVRAD